MLSWNFLTAALLIFVPSVPKGKKEWGNRKDKNLSLMWEDWIGEPIKDMHPFGKTNPGLEEKKHP